MITKMKKLTLFVSNTESNVDADLTTLGQLGVMHMVPFQAPKHESIERVIKRIGQLDKAISVLELFENQYNESEITDETLSFMGSERGEIGLLEKVLQLDQKRIHLKNLRKEQSQQLNWFSEWGNISIADVNELKEKNTYVKLYLLSGKEVKSIDDKENVYLFGNENNLFRVALISQNPNEKLDFIEIPFPVFEIPFFQNNWLIFLLA